MGAGKYVAPNYTTQSGTTYPLNIDRALEILRRLAAGFNPSAQDVPNMTVRIDAGSLYVGAALTEIAAQNSGVITAPVTNPRIDRIVINPFTGVVSAITGAEAASPTPPAITVGTLPVCRIALATSTAQITDSLITDERQLLQLFISGFVTTLLDDLTASDFLTTLRNALSAETAPAVDDEVLLRDTSGGTVDRITLENLLRVINVLTEDTAPDQDFDFVVTYDATVGLPKKVKLKNLLSVKPAVKDHGTQGANYTLQLDLAEMHLIAFSAPATLTIASALANDKGAVVVKNGGHAITLAGINDGAPALTQAVGTQDRLGLMKSFGRMAVVATDLNKPAV